MCEKLIFFNCSYAELIADWPVVVLGVCTVLIVVCALVGILVPDLPDFSNPLQVSLRNIFCRDALRFWLPKIFGRNSYFQNGFGGLKSTEPRT